MHETVVLDLSGNWTMRATNASLSGLESSYSAQVPGSVQMALLAAGVIDDPNYRDNDVNYRWIAGNDWIFERKFQAGDDLRSSLKKYMVFEGMDTVARVSLNGLLVVETENMHQRFVVDVTSQFRKSGDNTIEVEFRSPIAASAERSEAYPYFVPSADGPYHGEEHRNFIRKAQCHFGWDWGPCHLPIGIWKPISIVGSSYAWVDQALVVTESWTADGDAELKIDAFLHVAAFSHISVRATVEETGEWSESTAFLNIGDQVATWHLTVKQPKLWWPNGYGNPFLYHVTIEVTHVRFVFQRHVIHRSQKVIGFRTVELVTDPLENGETFKFRINGRDTFIKGTNWIPADSFENRVTSEYRRSLVQAAKDANMNLLRVWGGGIYQPDEFYDLCDEMGILVWQELMFACALYPRDSDFLSSVSDEVDQQVRRLGSHASVVLWSANNENEGALKWFDYELPGYQDPWVYVVDYSVLYIDTIRSRVLYNDLSRPFWPSSPSNGPLSSDPYVVRFGNAQSENFGDEHYYNYIDDCMDVSKFPSPRFASEYGWMSFPSFITLSEATVSDDWSIDSEMMEHRQHHPNGTVQMTDQIKKWFNYPNFNDSTYSNFKSIIWLSQVMQAMCIKEQTEHYRRGSGTNAQTMGSIYWQHNDIWQAPSWSSLEFGGRWKVLHYFAKKFYRPAIVTATEIPANRMNFSVTADNSFSESWTGVLSIDVVKWDNASVVHNVESGPFDVIPGMSKIVMSLDVSNDILVNNTYFRDQVVLDMRLEDSQGAVVSDNVFYLMPFIANPNILPPSLALESVVFANSSDPTIAVVTISTVNTAPFVWLETTIPGHFSDNGFLFVSGSKDVEFFGERAFSAAEMQSTLTLRSLRDTYI